MASLPNSHDVIIVGGGVIGASVAYFLAAEHQVRCLVLERDAIACGASGGAAGELGAVGRHDFSESFTRFLLQGIELHARMAPALLEESGIDYLLTDTPMLRPAFDDHEAEELKSDMDWQREMGMEVEWLDEESVRKLDTWLSTEAIGAAHTVERQLEAYPFALAVAQAGERHGVRFLTAEVAGVIRSGSRVTGVTTSRGPFTSDVVVVANGPWIKSSGPWLGMDLPVIPLRGQIIHLIPPAGAPMPAYALFHESGYLLPKPGGDLLAGTTQEDVGFDSSTTDEARKTIMDAVMRIAPGVADAPIKDHTACLRPYSLDELPIIGAVPGSQSLYVATGHAFKGVTLALVTGKCLAQLIVQGSSDIPLHQFSPARFASPKR